MTAISTALAANNPSTLSVDRFRNLTSTAIVHSLLTLVAQPQFASAKLLVRSAQDVRMDDLSSSNAILIGGPRANPWVELYEPASDFRLVIAEEAKNEGVDPRIVVNKTQQPGERASYPYSYKTEEGYVHHSILSFLPSLDGHGHVLLFQGGDMGSTQAAADFATDRQAMEPILRKARRSDGTLRNFEVLLETRVVGASSAKAKVVLIHIK